MGRMIKTISLSPESYDLANKLFPNFSEFVEAKIREAAMDNKQLLEENPEINKEIERDIASAIRVVGSRLGSSAAFTYAKRWEGIIKEKGGYISAAEIVKRAKMQHNRVLV